MDNLTHTLTGVMMSRAGLNRWCPRATPVLLMAVNAPDVDVVTAFGGALTYLDYHRGATHALLGAPVVSLLPLVVMLAVARKGMRWRRAYAVSLLGVASHVALDWTNIYGVRLLAPLSEKWFQLDITGVIDLWIWTVLLLASAWLLLSRLVSSEIGARPAPGRAVAVVALAAVLTYDLGRFVLHRRAVAVLDSRIYAGVAPRRVAALPSFASPFRWGGLVETDGSYIAFDMDLLEGQFDPAAGRTFYKPAPDRAIEAARKTPTFQRFLRFSQYPLWRLTPVDEPEEGVRAEAMDIRFGLPGRERFIATALLDKDLRVTSSWYRFDPPGRRPHFR